MAKVTQKNVSTKIFYTTFTLVICPISHCDYLRKTQLLQNFTFDIFLVSDSMNTANNLPW